MDSPANDTNNCELTSVKYYRELDSGAKTTTYESFCDSDENLLNNYPQFKDFCLQLASNLENLEKEKKIPSDMNKYCTYMQLWLQHKVINLVESKSIILYIILLYKIWGNILEKIKIDNKNECETKYFPISVDYRLKWKKMHDYNYNYKKVQCALQNKVDCNESCNESCTDNCKEDYCKCIADIFNIHKEFEKVCSGEHIQRCPVFWKEFQQKYSIISDIESKCKDVYNKHGFYKVKMHFGEQDIEEYIEQYESYHIFSFFEKFIGYSIKYYLSKTIHYSKYIVLPILLILLFYFFMKKLSLFGSKIAPKADDMRKMWRNVQGVTNPASLLNPMKPPGGGKKIGLPFLPK
ncbi:PIR protein [Plasmodium ovale]|uniref:PIR protein n=1 Tax=Plasmodium ovale TaxID=36330 RepID=A0A1D3JFD9_PLAOA|nr:PIR protein [Plasmodium ovale]